MVGFHCYLFTKKNSGMYICGCGVVGAYKQGRYGVERELQYTLKSVCKTEGLGSNPSIRTNYTQKPDNKRTVS